MKYEEIIDEAKKRFAYCEDVEAENYALWKEDLKFANGDSDNQYQWEDAVIKSRYGRPCITVNKVKQHNLQITNEAKKGRSAPKVIPVDSGADRETAEILNGIIKHIEAQSGAESAYSTAIEYQVDAGLGFWRIVTDYADDSTFDQEIYIERVQNPLNVRLDPDIKKADGSDARYGFVYEDIARDEYELKYGTDLNAWTAGSSDWQSEKTVRVCEYFRVVEKYETLSLDGKTRKVCKKNVEWFLLSDGKILDRKDWPGKYIPIVRVVGLETVIDGKTVRTSHTRAMKDPQRIYNLWSSSAVEFVQLQGKQPYISAFEAIEGHEDKWDGLNENNDPYLPYNSVDENGNPIPMPRRQEPPAMAQAYIEGMQISANDMQAVSGQYDGAFGKNVNQQSGVALRSVERQGENATFHFVDNSDIAKRFTALILVDLIPKIYDTERIVMIIGEDGSQKEAQLNPDIPGAVLEVQGQNGSIEKIYNPLVGRYDVVSTVGASYETKRVEAAEAMIAMSQANPAIWQTHGDLIAKSQDWPMADEFAKRFEKIMAPGLIEKEGEQPPPDPQIEQLQQQVQQLDGVIEKMTADIESKEHERKIANDKIEIERFNAETNRQKTVPAKENTNGISEIDSMMQEADLQLKKIALRKAEAEARMAELQAEIAGGSGESGYSEEEEMKALEQLEEITQSLNTLAAAMEGIQNMIVQTAKLSAIAAGPRRSELELNEEGLPVGSVSYPISNEE